MGNWRTVHIEGECPADQVAALKERLCVDYMEDGFERWGPLSWSPRGSLCGLNDWVSTDIDTVGNLAERDYSPEDVADELRELVKLAPGLTLQVHCGGDWESVDCVATIYVGGPGFEGEVLVEAPAIEVIRKVTQDESASRVDHALIAAMGIL